MFERMKRRFGDRVERRVVATGAEGVRYVRPVRPEEATGLVAAVYCQLERDFQLLAPITLTSPLPSLLAASWTVLRETLVAGGVPRLEKELVAEAVSKANVCPYCVAAKNLLKSKGLEWSEIRIDLDPAQHDDMLARSGGRRTVPQIFVNESHIGGFDDLVAADRSGRLAELVGAVS